MPVFDMRAAEVPQEVLEHEAAENYVKEKVRAEGVIPGKYYPPTAELIARCTA